MLRQTTKEIFGRNIFKNSKEREKTIKKTQIKKEINSNQEKRTNKFYQKKRENLQHKTTKTKRNSKIE